MSCYRRAGKDVSQLLSLAESKGFSVSRTRKNHWRISSAGGVLLFCSGTPSEPRAIKNFRALLKKVSDA